MKTPNVYQIHRLKHVLFNYQGCSNFHDTLKSARRAAKRIREPTVIFKAIEVIETVNMRSTKPTHTPRPTKKSHGVVNINKLDVHTKKLVLQLCKDNGINIS